MILSNFATRNVLTVAPGDSIDTAISLMEEHGFRHLPVVESNRPVGMISDRDVLLGVGWKLSIERHVDDESDRVAGPRSVREIMSHPVVTLSPIATLHQAAHEIITRRISAIPLVNASDHLVGIVTRTDLLARGRKLAGKEPTLAVLNEAVRGHMRAGVVTVGLKTQLHEAAHLMREKHIRHLPVIAQDALLGMITDRDLRRVCGTQTIEDEQSEAAGATYFGASTVLEFMTKNVRTISPDDSLLDAIESIVGLGIGALPVMHDRRLVGILTDTDIVRALGLTDA